LQVHLSSILYDIGPNLLITKVNFSI